MIHRAILVATCALTLLAAPAHAEVLAIDGGISDNYKASFNADPQLRELRTWLSFDRISAAGTTWAPATPVAPTFTAPLTVYSADGRSAQLSVSSTSPNVASVLMRVSPPNDDLALRWGPLVTLRAPMGSSNPKVRIDVSLVGAGVNATGIVDYWASAFTGSGSSIEANGPSGRWRIEGFPLDTDWQANRTPARRLPAAIPLAPTATRLVAFTRAGRRYVQVRARAVQGARVLLTRYRIGRGRYSPWRRAALAYPLPRRTVLVTAQVRDVRGFASRPLTRSVG